MAITSLKATKQIRQQSKPTSSPLTRDEIAGNFSLLTNRPITIESTPGVVLHVLSGLVQVCHSEEEGQQLVQGGQTFVLDRTGPVGITALACAEVRIEWPLVTTPRISRPSEPLKLYAYA
jgi:hypothetical protein